MVGICGALALSSLALNSREDVRIVRGEVAAPMAMFSAEVTVGEPRAGLGLVDAYGGVEPTDRTFLVVPVRVFEERGGTAFFVGLRAGERYYDPWSGSVSLSTQPGFASDQDVVFELAAEDLSGELVLELKPSGSLQLGSLRGEVGFSAPAAAPQVSYERYGARSVP